MLTTSLFYSGVLYELLIGFMFVVLFLSVLLIATCGRLSWPALWITFGCTIKLWLIVWLTDRPISKSFLCHHCIVYVFCVRTAPVRSQHAATRCILCNSRPRLLLKLACSRLRPRCCCCCFCCRHAAVGTPYERRQNGWLHAETAGDYKRRCWIVTNRI